MPGRMVAGDGLPTRLAPKPPWGNDHQILGHALVRDVALPPGQPTSADLPARLRLGRPSLLGTGADNLVHSRASRDKH